MEIPVLEKSGRNREYESYTSDQCFKVIKGYIFDGLSYRKIEEKILGLDSDYFRGYQAMGILHYLGITDEFKGLFKGMSLSDAILELKSKADISYNDLIGILSGIEISESQSQEDINSEVAVDYTVGKEGQKKQIYTTRYERNPKLRKMAIQIHGLKCMACGFDFEERYGQRGEGYIEVHHVVPLANQEEQIQVNPYTDLVTLCANCHRIVHRKKNEILSLEELKNIIRK